MIPPGSPITINNPNDPRIQFFHLRELGAMNPASAMLVDSERVIRRFLRHGLILESFLGTAAAIAALRDEFPDHMPEALFAADHAVLEGIVGFRFHQGAVARFRRPDDAPLMALGERIVVCDGLVDAENLGAIVRSAHAMGFTGLLIGETSCSPWLRRAIRVSMGSIVKLRVRHSTDLARDLDTLRASGVFVAGLALTEDAVALNTLTCAFPAVALVVGSENDGIRAGIRAHCSTLTMIPMMPGCDSLNAAVAAAIACYHFRAPTP